MLNLKTKLVVSDSFVMPGNEAGTPLALARTAAKIAGLAEALPPGTSNLDLSTLSVQILEGGQLVLLSVETTARAVDE